MPGTGCPKCGAIQEGGDECLRCGIVFERYKPSGPGPRKSDDSSAIPDSPNRAGLLRKFYRGFRWFSLCVTLIAVAMILRNPSPPRVDTDPRAVERVDQKFREMQHAAERGHPFTLQLDEAELNGWLSHRLAPDPSTQDSTPPADRTHPSAGNQALEEVRSNVREVKIDLLGDRLRGYVTFDFHGKDLSLMIEGRLSVQDGYLRLQPTEGRLGSLPLPQASLESAVARLFESPENREKFRLPPEISDVRIDTGELVVSRR